MQSYSMQHVFVIAILMSSMKVAWKESGRRPIGSIRARSIRETSRDFRNGKVAIAIDSRDFEYFPAVS